MAKEGNTGQGVLEGFEPAQPTRIGEDTAQFAQGQVGQKDRWRPVRKTEDPLTRTATEVQEPPERSQIGPATHTVPKGREVWCFDGDPGRAPFATFTTDTLPLTETGRRRKTGLRDGGTKEFQAPGAFETYRDGKTYDHLPGTVVATPHAKRRRVAPAQSTPPRA